MAEQAGFEGIRQARHAALSHAILGLMPLESYVSYPVPVPGPSGPALGFFLCRHLVDLDAGTDQVFAPEVALLVDAQSLKARDAQTWRENRGDEGPLAARVPPAARALPPDALAALELELFSLLPVVSAQFHQRAEPASPDNEAIERFDLLFRFLVPAELFPCYERLGPDFFAWLRQRSGRGAPVQVAEPPATRLELPPHLRVGPDPLLEGRTFTPGVDWRIGAGALSDALSYLELIPQEPSPLRQLDRSTPVEGFTLPELVPDWPTDAWRTALQTLCDPGWLIERELGDAEGRLSDRYYVSRGSEPVVWVLHDALAGEHLVSFPRDPREVADGLLRWLDTEEASPTAHSGPALHWSEWRALLALQDLGLEAPEAGAAFRDEQIGAAAEGPREPGKLRWSNLALAAAPVSLPMAPVERGIQRLVERGWLERRGDAVTPRAPLPELLEALGRPAAFGRLTVQEYQGVTWAMGRGFLAVRSEGGLWVAELAEGWECGESSAEDPRLHLLQLSGAQLASLVDALLGIT